jgi:hypothetical protein
MVNPAVCGLCQLNCREANKISAERVLSLKFQASIFEAILVIFCPKSSQNLVQDYQSLTAQNVCFCWRFRFISI